MGAGAGGWNWGTGAYRQITLEEAILNAYVPVYVRSRVLSNRHFTGCTEWGLGLGLTDRGDLSSGFSQHPAAAACSTAGRGAAANDSVVSIISAWLLQQLQGVVE